MDRSNLPQVPTAPTKRTLRFDDESEVVTPAARRPKLEPVVAHGLDLTPAPVVGPQTVARINLFCCMVLV